MNGYLPEAMQPCPAGYSRAALDAAMRGKKILAGRAVCCEENHDLIVELGTCRGRIPRLECAEGIGLGRTREIAILRCVGRTVCFQVTGFSPEGEAILSRRLAQREAMEHLLRTASPGDILPAVVTGCAAFGAFCDVGCGAVALLPTRRLCVSRLQHAGELLSPGQRIYAAIAGIDRVQRRVALSMRELLGSWEENAAEFHAGQAVPGIVRSLTDYGAFIELTPNLCGLAENGDALAVGEQVAVYIKAIVPQTLKIKLNVLQRLPPQPRRMPRYTKTAGHLNQWRYGSEAFAKCYTIF